MAKRMLIDASHPEDTRVVVLSGNRLEEFDYETTARAQLKGNIYLAKITRVEPSLQAAFVEFGGNRHGFLPFGEIHPDYYRIPVADRQELVAEEAALRGAGDEDENGDLDEEAANGGGEAVAAAERAGENGEREPDGDVQGDEEVDVEQIEVETRVDTVGGDEIDDQARRRVSLLRRYKIQEVIKRRQVILVQVSKEQRGTKGAALTTYLSLAGRYCVLMPNTARGGGISRKIANPSDRRHLKKIISELEIPEGIAVIVRTAGSQRSKAEIRRDYEYLLRMWDQIRETTLQSTAPCLIYEEANLIKRSIRDLYSRDMDEVLVEGAVGYKAAKAFMRNLMPSHAKKVKQHKDPAIPLFHEFRVEGQLEAMHSSIVQLKSGGYIVLNQTEALVAIDVNSGKATRERHIESTALKTNLEAAEEVARQLRLRDLAGLVVVDFIDMEKPRNNREVERKLKEAMRGDRARIQLGRISPFGLLELSRQRLRPSLFESAMDVCPRCGGSGHVRSVSSSALNTLRGLEEEGMRGREGEIRVAVPTPVALYVLNELRERLNGVEQRYGIKVRVETDDELLVPDFRLERLSPSPAAEKEAKAAEEEGARKRRRRGRRRGAEAEGEMAPAEAKPAEAAAEQAEQAEAVTAAPVESAAASEERKKTRRRRGKRGGRRRSRRRGESPEAGDDEALTEAAPLETEERVEPPAPERAAGSATAAAAAGDEATSPRAGTKTAKARSRKSPARRTRKAKTTKPKGETAQAEEQAGETAVPPTTPETGDAAPQADGDAEPPGVVADTPPGAPELPAGAAAQEEGGEESEPDSPKRRGWWQRWV